MGRASQQDSFAGQRELSPANACRKLTRPVPRKSWPCHYLARAPADDGRVCLSSRSPARGPCAGHPVHRRPHREPAIPAPGRDLRLDIARHLELHARGPGSRSRHGLDYPPPRLRARSSGAERPLKPSSARVMVALIQTVAYAPSRGRRPAWPCCVSSPYLGESVSPCR